MLKQTQDEPLSWDRYTQRKIGVNKVTQVIPSLMMNLASVVRDDVRGPWAMVSMSAEVVDAKACC